MNQKVHASGCTEYSDGYQDSYQIRNDADSCLESLFGSVDKGIVDVYLFSYTGQDKTYDDDKQENIGEGGGIGVNLCTSQCCEKIDDTSNEQAGSSQNNRMVRLSRLIRW